MATRDEMTGKEIQKLMVNAVFTRNVKESREMPEQDLQAVIEHFEVAILNVKRLEMALNGLLLVEYKDGQICYSKAAEALTPEQQQALARSLNEVDAAPEPNGQGED
jgi:hypothetical protein